MCRYTPSLPHCPFYYAVLKGISSEIFTTGFNVEASWLGTPHLVGTVTAAIVIFVVFSIICFCLCEYHLLFRFFYYLPCSYCNFAITIGWTRSDTRYQRQQLAALRRKAMAAPELQLSRLRGPSSSMVSEYNPNYEFGSGAPCSVQGLKEIPRENLRLVRLVRRQNVM